MWAVEIEDGAGIGRDRANRITVAQIVAFCTGVLRAREFETATVRSDLLSNEAGPEREADEAGNVVNIQALHQLRAMILDRFGADI